MTTPLYPTFKKRVADAIGQLNKHQVTPWFFMGGGRPFRIKSFDGRQISYEGVEFEGSPREVFWSRYIEPFLEELCTSEIMTAVSMARERGVDARLLLPELQGLLSAGVRKVYANMAEVDQRLRGKGYPEKVERKSIEPEIQAMDQFLNERISVEISMWKPEFSSPGIGKSMRDLVKKGLIGAAGIVAAVALQRIDAPIWLLFVTVVIFLLAAVILGWFLSTNTRKWGLGGVAVAYTLLTAGTLWMVPDGLSVSINCSPVAIPLNGAQGDSLYAIYLDPKWGNQLVFTPSASWPPGATTNDRAYRCEVVNNGKFALHGLSVVFMTTFREGAGLPTKREIAIISPVSVEPQHSVVFHLADDTKQAQEVIPPESVSARVGDDKERRKIPVRYPTVDGRPVKLRGFNP
jgi:hypothetical protein